MGAIREIATGQVRTLEPNHVVGRAPAPTSSLTVNKPYVSGVHAELRWTGQGWELKDRGSRNGTYLDGRRLEPIVSHAVQAGSKISFGAMEQEWEMIDESAPTVMVVPLGGGPPVILQGELIPLPSSEDPRATIYRGIDGTWVLESPDEAPIPISHMQTFEAVGRLWRFCCTDMSQSTIAAPGASMDIGMRVLGMHLCFSVSRDEEYVRLRMTCGTRDFDMGDRKHNYLLLTLARYRLKEAAEGVIDSACGWMDQEELARDPSMAPPQLNLDVYRIREQFAKVGVVDAAGIIERRPRPRALRVGARRITVTKV
jgi:hypothetical protein